MTPGRVCVACALAWAFLASLTCNLAGLARLLDAEAAGWAGGFLFGGGGVALVSVCLLMGLFVVKPEGE